MTEDILFEKKGAIAWVTLNRPRALNAMTHEMVQALDVALREWEHDPQVQAVVLKGAGEKGLCAGGDIRHLYETVKSNRQDQYQFFKEEYALNQYIYHYPKPYIAIMDGIVMGGGMGIAQGAGFRIVTERSKIAMPEVAIGFFPDVGASHFLKQCPGQIANYLALTGLTIGPEDTLFAHLADWYLPSSQLTAFYEMLQTSELNHSVQSAVQITNILIGLQARQTPHHAPLEEKTHLLETVFSLPNVSQMMLALETIDQPNAQEILKVMQKRSPMAMVGTHRLLLSAQNLTMSECFDLELRLGVYWFEQPDFLEGVRSVIIDKDHTPQWSYTLEDLTPAKVAEIFPLFRQSNHQDPSQGSNK